jgi:hypothetical protein
VTIPLGADMVVGTRFASTNSQFVASRSLYLCVLPKVA